MRPATIASYKSLCKDVESHARGVAAIMRCQSIWSEQWRRRSTTELAKTFSTMVQLMTEAQTRFWSGSRKRAPSLVQRHKYTYLDSKEIYPSIHTLYVFVRKTSFDCPLRYFNIT